MTIGERIKIRRNELQLTQRDLAQKMGYSNHTVITKIEANKVDLPQSRISQLAQVLDTSIAYLMGWDEKEFEEMQKNNDTLSDIVVRLRTDNEFFSIVKACYEMEPEKLRSLLTFIK